MQMSEPRPLFGGLFAPRPMSRIEYGQGETIVHLRVPRSLLVIFTHLLILVAGGAGSLFVGLMMSVGTGDPAFYRVWLTLWTAGLIFVVVRLLWFLFGRERLIARNSGLTLARSILFLPWNKTYATNDVGQMRYIADDPARSVRINNRRIPQSALGITANGHELKLAHGISQAEAKGVIDALKQRLVPQGRRR